ncbi:MAG: ATP-binding protein [Acidobacteriota bacterium]|nr:ATP-binding protein [Acidobacteriota bacterium]MDH3784853.1 ATP-binding protein [Acidobacteriota bacterium]
MNNRDDPWPLRRREFAIRVRRHFPSTKTSLNEGVNTIIGVARKCGCTEDQETDLEIALREALANAMIHGNAFEKDKTIFVRAYGSDLKKLLILVRDEGEGFDPTDVPDPRNEDRMHLHHGRGLFLMRELMDIVEFRRNGREVLIYKQF